LEINTKFFPFPRYGALGVLYTLEEFRGQGFAKICMQFMAKHVQDIGLTPFAYVETDNFASIALMEKLGFEPVEDCLWILTHAN
jgi:predicted GNAT family acetyltransferase